MKLLCGLLAAWFVSAGLAQERKPVPKDSLRLAIPGCAKGYMFTALSPGPGTEEQPYVVPEGTHLRMSAPKKLIAEIKEQAGSRIEITGVMKKGQFLEEGVRVAPGVRITGGSAPAAGNLMPTPGAGQIVIDVESWRRVPGDCPR